VERVEVQTPVIVSYLTILTMIVLHNLQFIGSEKLDWFKWTTVAIYFSFLSFYNMIYLITVSYISLFSNMSTLSWFGEDSLRHIGLTNIDAFSVS
jgi:hypothetical protein